MAQHKDENCRVPFCKECLGKIHGVLNTARELTNPPKEKDTPKEPMALEKLIDDIYGKDVVSYAYASPAGTITKEQAIAGIKAWAENPETVTRFEVIDETGRAYTKWGKVQLSYQDDDRTLKVFIRSNK